MPKPQTGEIHASFVFPLAPKNTRWYRTLCGDSIPYGGIYRTSGTPVSCYKCLTRLKWMKDSFTELLKATKPNTDGERHVWRCLAVLGEALDENKQAAWYPFTRHNWRDVSFVVFRRGDKSFFTWGLSRDEPDKDNCYLSASDAEFAARQYIDASITE